MRIRLTLWVSVIFTIILWFTVGVFWLYQRASINTFFVDMLSQRTTSIASQLDTKLPELTRADLDQIANETVRSVEFETIVIEVFTLAGEYVIPRTSVSVNAKALPLEEVASKGIMEYLPDPIWSSDISPDVQFGGADRAMLFPVIGSNGQNYVLFVATTDRFAQEQLATVRGVLVTAAVVAPFLGLLSGWFISGIAVAPFRKLQVLARQMGPEFMGKALEFEPSTSEVTELAQELEQSRARMQDAFEAQERFLSNVSHEIKTPIAVMLIESQTIDVSDQPDDIQYFVESVQEEMSRLGKLVESFLTLTRIEDGHSRVRGKKYAANDLAMDSVEHCATMANQMGVWLRPKLFADDETIDTLISGEPELLTTMLDNLIRNAIRFSPHDAGVEIVLSIEDGNVGFAVRDDGPGIPEDKLNTIFDRFAQAKKSERKGRGHGLGLAIAKGIAELHGGTITVQNYKEGCEFKVLLPVYTPPKSPE